MASVLKVDKLDPQSGTALELGTSGDTITVPSGATLTVSGTMNASSITAGTVATARLGSGTASSSTVLYGDQTYKAEPGGVSGMTSDGTDITITSGDLIIGTAGKGIDFSAQTPTSATGATATGEVLNHYETGSWTPIFQDDSTACVSYNAQVGEYTRIGNWVCASFRIIPNDMGSMGTSSSTFTGLPFVINSATYHVGTMQMQGLKTSNLIPNLGLIHYPGQAKGAIYAYRETTSTSSIFPASTYWDNDTTIGGLFMYQTDA